MKQHVTVVPSDHLVFVDGFALCFDFSAPKNMHALQWHEGSGHIEWTDDINHPLTPDDYAADVAPFVALWEAETARLDEEAAAAGAAAMFPGRRCVIVAAGTAVPLALMSAAPEFRGGNISAGLKMRLRALHIFTGRLPQVEAAGRLPEIGDDTETALRCGAERGNIAEIRDKAAIAGPAAQILLTGGAS